MSIRTSCRKYLYLDNAKRPATDGLLANAVEPDLHLI